MLQNPDGATQMLLLLTFIASLTTTGVTVFYTRKNLKTTKYIETITSERIKWLSLIRDEVSDIVTNIQYSLKQYLTQINEIQDYNDSNKDDIEKQYIVQQDFLKASKESGYDKERNIWTQKDFIKRLNLLKLRINPFEDKEITEIIDYFIFLYSEKKPISNQEVEETTKNLSKLISEAQILLKKEWEKIKKESKGKYK